MFEEEQKGDGRYYPLLFQIYDQKTTQQFKDLVKTTVFTIHEDTQALALATFRTVYSEFSQLSQKPQLTTSKTESKMAHQNRLLAVHVTNSKGAATKTYPLDNLANKIRVVLGMIHDDRHLSKAFDAKNLLQIPEFLRRALKLFPSNFKLLRDLQHLESCHSGAKKDLLDDIVDMFTAEMPEADVHVVTKQLTALCSGVDWTPSVNNSVFAWYLVRAKRPLERFVDRLLDMHPTLDQDGGETKVESPSTPVVESPPAETVVAVLDATKMKIKPAVLAQQLQTSLDFCQYTPLVYEWHKQRAEAADEPLHVYMVEHVGLAPSKLRQDRLSATTSLNLDHVLGSFEVDPTAHWAADAVLPGGKHVAFLACSETAWKQVSFRSLFYPDGPWTVAMNGMDTRLFSTVVFDPRQRLSAGDVGDGDEEAEADGQLRVQGLWVYEMIRAMSKAPADVAPPADGPVPPEWITSLLLVLQAMGDEVRRHLLASPKPFQYLQAIYMACSHMMRHPGTSDLEGLVQQAAMSVRQQKKDDAKKEWSAFLSAAWKHVQQPSKDPAARVLEPWATPLKIPAMRNMPKEQLLLLYSSPAAATFGMLEMFARKGYQPGKDGSLAIPWAASVGPHWTLASELPALESLLVLQRRATTQASVADAVPLEVRRNIWRKFQERLTNATAFGKVVSYDDAQMQRSSGGQGGRGGFVRGGMRGRGRGFHVVTRGGGYHFRDGGNGGWRGRGGGGGSGGRGGRFQVRTPRQFGQQNGYHPTRKRSREPEDPTSKSGDSFESAQKKQRGDSYDEVGNNPSLLGCMLYTTNMQQTRTRCLYRTQSKESKREESSSSSNSGMRGHSTYGTRPVYAQGVLSCLNRDHHHRSKQEANFVLVKMTPRMASSSLKRRWTTTRKVERMRMGSSFWIHRPRHMSLGIIASSTGSTRVPMCVVGFLFAATTSNGNKRQRQRRMR